MSSAADDVLVAAMALPPEARAHLAERLLDTLEPGGGGIDPAWRAEIEARIREVDEGRADLIPHDRAMTDAREHLRARRVK